MVLAQKGNFIMNRASQSGFAIIDVMVAITIWTSIWAITATHWQKNDEELWARQIGNELMWVNNAWRDRLSGTPSFPDGVYINWEPLRHTSCAGAGGFLGTAPDHYLPCNVDITNTVLGRYYFQTVVTSTASGVPGVNVKIATTTTIPIEYSIGSGITPKLAGQISSYANGFSINKSSPIGATTFTGYSSDVTTAVVTATTTSNPVADSWLRTDGVNFQNAHITYSLGPGGVPQSDLRNARDVISQRLVNWDDPSYFIDLDDTSEMNDINFSGGDANLTASTGDMNLSTSSAGSDINLSARRDVNITAVDDVVLRPGPSAAANRVIVAGSGILQARDIFIQNKEGGNVALSQLLPNYSTKAGYRVRHNTLVPKPSCPNGTPKITLHLGNQSGVVEGFTNATRFFQSAGWGKSYYARDASATLWRTYVRDTANSTWRSQDYIIAMTHCQYL